jgi:hypothetical protein
MRTKGPERVAISLNGFPAAFLNGEWGIYALRSMVLQTGIIVKKMKTQRPKCRQLRFVCCVDGLEKAFAGIVKFQRRFIISPAKAFLFGGFP